MLGTGVTAETTEIDESSCPHGTGSSLESVSKIKKETVQFLKYFFGHTMWHMGSQFPDQGLKL